MSTGDLAFYPGLGDAATRALRDMILSGELRDGERIVEREIADRLGVSRGPVRDALRQLDVEGLVVNLPRRGARVASLTAADGEEIMTIRAAVEPLAVRALVTGNGPAAIRPGAEGARFPSLQAIVDDLHRACDAGDWSSAVLHDFALHRQIHVLSGRRRLLHTWDSISAPLLHIFRLSRDLYPRIADIATKHQRLLDDIVTGDPDRAENAVRAHVTEFGPQLLHRMTSLEDRPHSGADDHGQEAR